MFLKNVKNPKILVYFRNNETQFQVALSSVTICEGAIRHETTCSSLGFLAVALLAAPSLRGIVLSPQHAQQHPWPLSPRCQ